MKHIKNLATSLGVSLGVNVLAVPVRILTNMQYEYLIGTIAGVLIMAIMLTLMRDE